MGKKTLANRNFEPRVNREQVNLDGKVFTSSGPIDKGSLPNQLQKPYVRKLCNSGILPADSEIIIPYDPIRAEWNCPGFICFLKHNFEVGLSFPVPDLVRSFFETFPLAPGQCNPGLWRLLYSVVNLCEKHGLALELEDVFSVYQVRGSGGLWYQARIKDGTEHLIHHLDKNVDRHWKKFYMFVKKDSLGEDDDFFSDSWREEDFPLKTFEPTEEGDSRIAAFLKIPISERTFPQSLVSKSEEEGHSPSIVVESDSSESPGMSNASRQTRSSIRNMDIASQIKAIKVEGGLSSVDSKAFVKKSIPVSPLKRTRKDPDDIMLLGEVSGNASDRLESFLIESSEAYFRGVNTTKVFEDSSVLLVKALQGNLVGTKRIKSMEAELVACRTEKKIAEEKYQKEIQALKDEHATAVKDLQEEVASLKADMSDNALFFGFKARLQTIEEYAKGHHREWDFVDAYKKFLAKYPDEIQNSPSEAEIQSVAQMVTARLAAEGSATGGGDKAEEAGVVAGDGVDPGSTGKIKLLSVSKTILTLNSSLVRWYATLVLVFWVCPWGQTKISLILQLIRAQTVKF